MTVFVLIADLILLAIMLHKLAAVIKCIAWISINGREFKEKLITLRADLRRRYTGRQATYGDICYVLWNVGGDKRQSYPAKQRYIMRALKAYDNGMQFAAMGFKEYRPLAYAERLMTSTDKAAQRRRGQAIRWLTRSYDFVPLGFVGGVLVILSGTVTRECHIHTAIWTLGLSIELIMILIITSIGVESMVNYAAMGSYGQAHHDCRSFVSDDLSGGFVVEVATLVGVAVAALYVDLAGISILSTTHLGRLGPIGAEGFGGLFNAFYNAFLTIIFSTQLTPSGPLGKLLVIFITLHGIAIIIVGVTAFSTLYEKSPGT
jgi:hypothetical protein